MPKISILSPTINRQAQYLCFLAKELSLGSYQNHGFWVLPSPNTHLDTVIFPNLRYPSVFWKTINRSPLKDFGQPFPTTLIDMVKEQLTTPNTSDFLTTWQHQETQLADFWAKQAGPRLWSQIKKINILPTSFGTRGSFNFSSSQIICTARLDLPISEIARTVFLSLYSLKTGTSAETGELAWYQRQAVGDYLFSNPVHYSNLSLAQQSYQHLLNLGLTIPSPPNLRRVNLLFTHQEQNLFQVLLTNSGKIVSFDQVADVIWGNQAESKFSLSALAKLIENIRHHLTSLNINRHLLVTKRGCGYGWLGSPT